jgi:hypothetical protein
MFSKLCPRWCVISLQLLFQTLVNVQQVILKMGAEVSTDGTETRMATFN